MSYAMERRPKAKLNSLGYPIRPGAELCDYFMSHGYCKFRENCRFDHPEEGCAKRLSKLNAKLENSAAKLANGGNAFSADASSEKLEISDEEEEEDEEPKLNSVGLPLFKNAEDCNYYVSSRGYCARRPRCFYNHPEEIAQERLKREKQKKNQEQSPKDHSKPEKDNKAENKANKNSNKHAEEKPVPREDDEDGEFQTVKSKKHTAPKVQYNSQGFPIRPGEEECQHYVNSLGYCKHGKLCKYSHPEWVCEHARDKPRASEVKPSPDTKAVVSHNQKSSLRKPDALAELDKKSKHVLISKKLSALGLPADACYYYYCEGSCRNISTCIFRHDLQAANQDGSENPTEPAETEVPSSTTTNEKTATPVQQQQQQQTAPSDYNHWHHENRVREALPMIQETKPPVSNLEAEATRIVQKLNLDQSLIERLVSTARECGAKESLTEVSSGILSQALMMMRLPISEVRGICKEVFDLRKTAIVS